MAGGPLPITASRMDCLLDALEHAYRMLGFDQAAGSDEVFADLVLFESRIYIRIYWPILVQEYWQYEGDIPIYGEYAMGKAASFFPFDQGLRPFFPALAIRNQMVIVPKGQNDILQGGSADPVAIHRDVTGVDFTDDAELGTAIVAVRQDLRSELRRELQAYGSFRKREEWDLTRPRSFLPGSPST